jgi:putative transcriptional regulator
MKRQTLSETLIDTARDLGLPKITVEKLEALGIPEVRKLTAKDIKKIREKVNVSQGVFAALLNVTTSTIHKWEQGTARPQTSALRLLEIISAKGIDVLRV